MEKDNRKSDAEKHRQKVEEKLKTLQSKSKAIISEADAIKLIGELEVHQIELEIQNEELLEAKHNSEKFTELYNFAPSGYLSLSAEGEIIELNFSAASLLEKERYQLLNNSFSLFIDKDSLADFIAFFNRVYKRNVNQSCELKIITQDNSARYVLVNATLSINKEQCLLTLIDITERKNAEQELSENEERYRGLLNNLVAGIVVHNSDTSIIESNHKASELLGLSEDQMKGKMAIDPNWKFIQEDNTPLPIEKYPVNLIKSTKHSLQNFVAGINRPLTHDVVWVLVNGFPVIDNNGDIIEIVISFIDITERKKTEQELQESSRFLKEIQLIAKLGSYTIDIATGNWTASEILEDILGIDASYNKNYEGGQEIIHPQWRKIMADYFMEEVIGKKKKFDYEYKIIRPNDKIERWVHCVGNLKFNATNEPVSLVATVRDITDRKNAEDAIKASEEKYRTLVEQASDAIFIANSAGKLIAVNTSLCKLSLYSKEELLQMSIYDFAITEDLQKNPFHFDELRQGKTVITERVMKGKGNKILHLEINAKLLNNGNLLVFVRDISERKKAEEELIIAKEKAEESDRLKSSFLANMSHEIRTPMNGILGFADLLKDAELSGQERNEYISIIEKSGARLLNIINDIIDISRIEAGLMKVSMKQTNINELLEYIFAFFNPEVEAKGMKLSFNTPLSGIKATIETDKEKLVAILTNLINNAIKYSEKGSILFGYIVEQNQLKFYVKDNGIGVPKDKLEAIFERFVQADIINLMARQGAGLGLSITKAFVEMLGGKIWVESEAGQGSTFYFTLPYNAEPLEETNIKNSVSAVSQEDQIKKLKILICDDDEISKLFIAKTVKEISTEVLKARTGLEAVEICSNNPDLDLILMDAQMPLMNGYEATRLIRQFNKDVVIIAQTGYALSEDRLKAIEAGCNDYLSKPFGKEELLAVIQKHFKK